MFFMEAIVNPELPGSRLDADHPENGVLIPCLFTNLTLTERAPALLRLASMQAFAAPLAPTTYPLVEKIRTGQLRLPSFGKVGTLAVWSAFARQVIETNPHW